MNWDKAQDPLRLEELVEALRKDDDAWFRALSSLEEEFGLYPHSEAGRLSRRERRSRERRYRDLREDAILKGRNLPR